ncbi:MAG: hypothetical protein PHP98_00290 [Kiritimatiellae bacterium]|nr:hypothetical protein [Kiritimatiellia bacterium]
MAGFFHFRQSAGHFETNIELSVDGFSFKAVDGNTLFFDIFFPHSLHRPFRGIFVRILNAFIKAFLEIFKLISISAFTGAPGAYFKWRNFKKPSSPQP